jgi:Flp pilus assembly protein TadG
MAAEMILLLPIVAGLLLGTIEFSIAFYARQQLLLAAREGARVGAQGGTDQEVTATVARILGAGPLGDAQVSIVRTVEDPSNPNGRDRITVSLELGTTHVVPNLLPYLVDLSGEHLNANVTMNVE